MYKSECVTHRFLSDSMNNMIGNKSQPSLRMPGADSLCGVIFDASSQQEASIKACQ